MGIDDAHLGLVRIDAGLVDAAHHLEERLRSKDDIGVEQRAIASAGLIDPRFEHLIGRKVLIHFHTGEALRNLEAFHEHLEFRIPVILVHHDELENIVGLRSERSESATEQRTRGIGQGHDQGYERFVRERETTLFCQVGKGCAVQEIPLIIAGILRGIAGLLFEARAQRFVGFVTEHRKPARNHIEPIAGEDAEVLVIARHANRKTDIDPALIAEAARGLHLFEERIDRKIAFLAVSIEEVDLHIRSLYLRQIDQHLHHDLVLVVHRGDEARVHAIGIILALDIEHLSDELVLHHRIDARAPGEHVRFDGKVRAPERRIRAAVFVELEHDLAFIQVRENDGEIRLRLAIERIEGQKVRRDDRTVLEARLERHDRVGRKAFDGDLNIYLAVALAHALDTNVHVSLPSRRNKGHPDRD